MLDANQVTFYRNGKGYVYASYYAEDGRAEVPIGRKATQEEWDSKKTDKGTRNTMNRVYLAVSRFTQKRDEANVPVLKAEIDELIRSVTGKKKKASAENFPTITQAIATYRGKIMNLEILNEGEPYSKSTPDQYRAMNNNLSDKPFFLKQLNEFTYADYLKFRKFLLDEDYSQNTIYNYNTNFMTFYKWSYKKLHTNKWWEDQDTIARPEEIEQDVYYTVDELRKIYATPHKLQQYEDARDVFVFGSCIGLRNIDLSAIKDAVTKGGIIQKDTKKVGKVVHVPMSSLAREVWDKHKGKLPILPLTTFLRGIRAVCEDAGFKDTCLYVRTEGGKRMEYKEPRHELTGSHTMRRNFATNAYLAGVPVPYIMRMGGWKTEASFYKYIKASGEETARLSQQHEHFK